MITNCLNCGESLFDGACKCPVKTTFIGGQGEGFPKGYNVNCTKIVVDRKLYNIVGLLGRGGLGIVLKISDKEGNQYALKVSFSFEQHFTNNSFRLSDELLASDTYLGKEITILKYILEGETDEDHRLKVHYAGEIGFYSAKGCIKLQGIVMEIAEATLKDIIRALNRGNCFMGFDKMIDVISELLLNLEGLHKRGVIHRDITPANIFIVKRSRGYRFVYGDFGNSREKVDCLNRTHSGVAGTPVYNDPARFLFDDYRQEPSIDVYGIAVVITELLVGETAIENFNFEPLETGSYFSEYFVKIPKLLLPPAVYEVLRDSLIVNPESRRYKEVSGFQRDLLKALERRKAEFTNKRKIKVPVLIDINYPLNFKSCSDLKEIFVDSYVRVKGNIAVLKMPAAFGNLKILNFDLLSSKPVGDGRVLLRFNESRLNKILGKAGREIAGRMVFGGELLIKKKVAGYFNV